MARRVAGRFVHRQRRFADRHRVAFDQPAIGFERHAAQAPAPAVLRQPRDPEAVGLVRAFDRHAQLVGKRLRLAAMVDMAMGQQDFFDRHAMLLRGGEQPWQIAAGIDKGAAHRLRTP